MGFANLTQRDKDAFFPLLEDNMQCKAGCVGGGIVCLRFQKVGPIGLAIV